MNFTKESQSFIIAQAYSRKKKSRGLDVFLIEFSDEIYENCERIKFALVARAFDG